jgi:enoyl-CoA hydratase/carnithine racemase
MADGLVTFERQGAVGTVRLNSPATGNRFDRALLQALDRALIAAEEDIDAKVIVIAATGSDFCLGEDAEAGTGVGGPGGSVAQALQDSRRFEYLSNIPRPVIVAVRGQCAGMGLALAMCCDFVICAEDARLSEPAVRNGATPHFALWPFFAWHKRAKELLLGRELSGAEAVAWGLATSSVPEAQLEAEVARYVDFLLLAPADALVWTKEMIAATVEARGGGMMWRDTALYQALAPVRV